MGALAVIVPAPYRWAAMVLAAVVLIGFGWVKGAGHVQAQWDAQKVATEIKIVKVQAAQEKASVRVITKYVDRVQTIHGATETIIREVPKYVPAQADHDCIVPAGVIRLLDPAASFGPFPGAARDADATAPTVEADHGDGSLAY